MKRSIASAGICVLLLGCGGDPGPSLSWAHSRQAVVGGEPSGEGDDFVVHLTAGTQNVRSGCSATLIAPNVVLTALHCVSNYDHANDEVACDEDGALVSTPPGGVIGGLLPPESIEIRLGAEYIGAPTALGASVFGTGSTQICRHDLAVVILDRELSAPIASLRLDGQTERGETMRVVGYGVNGTGVDARYVRGGVRVTAVGAVDDLPARGVAAPDTMVLGEGSCDGDSGGPAFSEATGALVGVYSISAGLNCTAIGVRNIYTLTAPFADVVEHALDVAGHSALREIRDAMAPTVGEGDAQAPRSEPIALAGSGSRKDPNVACAVQWTHPKATRYPWEWWMMLSVSGVRGWRRARWRGRRSTHQ